MKKTYSVLLLLTIGFITYLGIISTDSSKETKLDKMSKPSDHIFQQRSYPDNTIDIRAIEHVKSKVQADINERSNNRSLDNTSWLLEGPTNIGGRINCVTTHPSDNNIILSGCAAGGIFRSMDGGASWNSIANEISDLAISSIVFDPSNPTIIYVGTGDHNIAGTVNAGGGIYKSTDAGETWTNTGLVAQRIVSRIVINPNNTQVIYAATMGLPFERNEDRGLYKSTNGGDTWERVLFVSDEAGIIDIVMNPSNPNELFAASWNRIRNNHESIVSGTDAHIYRSTDAGNTWETLDIGLPMQFGEEVCRIGLSASVQHPGRVFSVIVGSDLNIQGVYRLDAGSTEWQELSINGIEDALAGFGWYFAQIRVNPMNDDEISILGVDLWTSYNGGNSWELASPAWFTYEVHADKHDMRYLDNGEILLATDGGLYKKDVTNNWFDIDEIPNSQIYRLAINPHTGLYTGGLQDNGTCTGDFANPAGWTRDHGGDGFQAIYSPDDENVYFAETQNGSIYDIGISGGSFNGGIDSDDRRNWDMPIIMSSHNSNTLYTGTYRIYKNTNNYNDNWQSISPMLTGEVIESNRFHTISTIAESKVNQNILYSGSTDAKVWRTMDGGSSWNEISTGLPERYVTDIKTSGEDAGIVYVAHSGYKDNDNTSHIHKSTDNGDTWVDISGDLISQPINHIEIIDDEKIVAATDMGVYYTSNGGVNWLRLGDNMPIFPVFDLAIDNENNKLIAGTFARSVMSFPLDSLFADPTGIEEDTQSHISVYPNPFKGLLNIESSKDIESIMIYDLRGKLVLEKTLTKTEIDLSSLHNGTYIMMSIDKNANVYSSKITKR